MTKLEKLQDRWLALKSQVSQPLAATRPVDMARRSLIQLRLRRDAIQIEKELVRLDAEKALPQDRRRLNSWLDEFERGLRVMQNNSRT